jgi:Ca2+-binding RTX toxin-like protein
MTLFVINALQGGLGIGYDLGTTDSLIVGQSGVVYSTNDIAITGQGFAQTVLVAGLVASAVNDAVNLGTGSTSGLKVTIASSGHLQAGDDGVQINGINAAVSNHGSIEATYGVFAGSLTAATQTYVLNTGVINATNTAIYCFDAAGNSVRLVNEGRIIGGSTAFIGGLANDVIENAGVMRGNIQFQSGNDSYSGAAGRVVGTIFGEGGNDSFIVGSFAETIDGGANLDTLDFSRTGGIRVALDGSFANTGVATGDSYVNIEVVKGSLSGADQLAGNGLNNALYGFGGADTLAGGAGLDGLVGGAGKDRQTGGAGHDSFYFYGLADCGDVITDFSNVAATNNDLFRMKGAAFGGLAVGALASGRFIARGDNQAQQADDRFVFRTTDKTLWFDANGSAAGGLTMVADLQASATLTYQDILII